MDLKEKLLNDSILSPILHSYLDNKVYKSHKRKYGEITSQLSKYKDIHKGERCFIIGTGPSLTIDDLEKLTDEITFAPNRVFEVLKKTEWTPTYYVNQDYGLLNNFSDEIKSIKSKVSFIPVDCSDRYPEENFEYFILKHKEFYPNDAPFSFDITKYIAQGFTTIYGAIQIAIYMGFKEIYLIGVDHNYSITRDAKGNVVRDESVKSNYSSAMSEYIDIKILPRIEETTISFETAEKMSRKNGFRIFNATRGGKLDAFEKVNFDDVLEIK